MLSLSIYDSVGKHNTPRRAQDDLECLYGKYHDDLDS